MSNPLTGIPFGNLMRDVEDFAREHDLEHIIYHLKKGALVAQSPNNIDNIDHHNHKDRDNHQRYVWVLY